MRFRLAVMGHDLLAKAKILIRRAPYMEVRDLSWIAQLFYSGVSIFAKMSSESLTDILMKE